MKRLSVSFLLIVIALSVMAACAKPSPTAAPPAKPTTAAPVAPAQSPAAKVITLSTHTHYVKGPLSMGYEWWGDEVVKRTGGKVQFKHYYSNSLGASTDQPENISKKLFDIGMLMPPYFPGKMPLHNVFWNPMISGSGLAYGKALPDLYKVPAFEAEVSKWNAKYLFPVIGPSNEYMGVKPVKKLEDFKGMRIRAIGQYTKFLAALGGAPVSMESGEMFDALQRGTIEGVFITYPSSMGSLGLWEVSKYIAVFGLGAWAAPMAINLDTWKSLPPDVQQAMVDAGQQVAQVMNDQFTKDDAEWLKKFATKNIDNYQFPATERARAADVAKPVHDGWIKDMNDKSLPGKDVLDALKAAVAKYSK